MSESVDMIRKHLKDAKVIFDLGCANIDPTQFVGDLNEYQELRAVYDGAEFVLVEPDPRWTMSIRNQIFYHRTSFFPVAIAALNGEVLFHQSIDWPWSSSIRRPVDHLRFVPEIKFAADFAVPCRSLDSIFNQLGLRRTVDLIWADIQGAEIDMIKGGTETFKRTRFLYTEYDNEELYEGQISLAGILELLPDFQVVDSWHNNVLMRNTKL